MLVGLLIIGSGSFFSLLFSPGDGLLGLLAGRDNLLDGAKGMVTSEAVEVGVEVAVKVDSEAIEFGTVVAFTAEIALTEVGVMVIEAVSLFAMSSHRGKPGPSSF